MIIGTHEKETTLEPPGDENDDKKKFEKEEGEIGTYYVSLFCFQ